MAVHRLRGLAPARVTTVPWCASCRSYTNDGMDHELHQVQAYRLVTPPKTTGKL